MSGGGSIRAAKAEIVVDVQDNTRQGIAGSRRALRWWSDEIQKIGRGLVIGGGITAGIGSAIQVPLFKAAQAAGDFNETLNRAQSVFKGLSKEAVAFGDNLARSQNRSSKTVLDGLASFQSSFIGTGFDDQQAFKLSKSVQQLSSDFASINNISLEDSNRRFISGLSGSGEVFDQFGIDIKVAALNQEFLRLGLKLTAKDATEAQKKLARYSILARTLGKQGVIGDAVKTANEFANSSKGVAAALERLQFAIGGALLPDLTKLNLNIIRVVNAGEEWARKNQDVIRTTAQVAAALSIAGGSAVVLGTSFVVAGKAAHFFWVCHPLRHLFRFPVWVRRAWLALLSSRETQWREGLPWMEWGDRENVAPDRLARWAPLQ